MAGVWKRYNPEVLEGYVGACAILEKGRARVHVLGDRTIRLVCYGGTENILPPLYVTDVPPELVERFRRSNNDAEIIASELSDKPEVFTRVVSGTATEKDIREAVRDIAEDWNAHNYEQQDASAMSRWRSAASRLKSLFNSHFPSPKKT